MMNTESQTLANQGAVVTGIALTVSGGAWME